MTHLIVLTLIREFKLYFRRQSDSIQPILFFMLLLSIFTLIFGESSAFLTKNFPGILWCCLALSLLVSENLIFLSDTENGVLSDLLLSPRSLLPIFLIKIFSHSVFIGFPLGCFSLLAAWLFQVDPRFLPKMGLAYFLSIPCFSLVTSLCLSLTLNLKKGGLLLAVLVLPLMFPVIVCGCSATQAITAGLPFLPHACLLLAIFLFLLMVTPLICVFALTFSGEN